jgi:hypothetical protein
LVQARTQTETTHGENSIGVPRAHDHAADRNAEAARARFDGVAQIVEVEGALGAPAPSTEHRHHPGVLRERLRGLDEREQLPDPDVAVVVPV